MVSRLHVAILLPLLWEHNNLIPDFIPHMVALAIHLLYKEALLSLSFQTNHLLYICPTLHLTACPDYQPHNQTQRSIHLHLQSPSLLMHPVNPDCSIYSQLQVHCQKKLIN